MSNGGQTLLARGVRSHHRPTRIEEAQELASQGATPLAGGARLLPTDGSVANVLDLVGLELTGLRVDDEDVEIGVAELLRTGAREDGQARAWRPTSAGGPLRQGSGIGIARRAAGTEGGAGAASLRLLDDGSFTLAAGPSAAGGTDEAAYADAAAAIVNAVSQAAGARLRELPLSPPRVLDAATARGER